MLLVSDHNRVLTTHKHPGITWITDNKDMFITVANNPNSLININGFLIQDRNANSLLTVTSECIPNSHYSISKLSASSLIKYYGYVKKLPLINLRLYSVYGPYEEPTRLIPVLCKSIQDKKLPLFADKNISRDFILN